MGNWISDGIFMDICMYKFTGIIRIEKYVNQTCPFDFYGFQLDFKDTMGVQYRTDMTCQMGCWMGFLYAKWPENHQVAV